MADLSSNIRTIKGIGEKKAQAFEKLGVFTLYDLVSFFPRKYEDRSLIVPIFETCDGQQVCIRAVIADAPRLTRVRKGMELVKFKVVDETGAVNITYFNQSWMKDNLHMGQEYIFYGKIEFSGRSRSMANPVAESENSLNRVTGKIVPVYRLCSGLNQKTVLQSVQCTLEQCSASLPEIIPESIMRSRQLARAPFSYENIHFPKDFSSLQLARRRLVYEELFVLACALSSIRSQRIEKKGQKFTAPDMSSFFSALPFSPTDAQKRAIAEAVADMGSGSVMNRLVQGDVGSGKTLVAAALAWVARENGYSSAFMAPTEILASQHLATLTSLLSPFGMHLALLTGSTSAKERKEILQKLSAGEIDLIIGTHALISSDVEYSRLGLVITDEQHRFGVAQRAAFVNKGPEPHVLVMSATPIPRTLALIIYGDLDVSIIDEMPPGRQKVDTYSVGEDYRPRLNAFIARQAAEGHQTFVVCPMVEENEENTLHLKSAEEHAARLKEDLPGLKIGCVHGRMKPKEKDAVMAAFSSGELNVLVSTTVIEVGVDVPSATLMIIENAERFGLSQLHQLRGRVGRGSAKSYCILVSDAQGEDVKARLGIMCKTNDGFKISEEDLRLRGPGDFLGSRQHGLPEMHVADLGADTSILKAAQEDANRLLSADPELDAEEHRLLRRRVLELLSENLSGLN